MEISLIKNFSGQEIKTSQSNLTLNNYTNMYVLQSPLLKGEPETGVNI